MAAEGITLGVAPARPQLPDSALGNGLAPAGDMASAPAVTKAFDETAPEIRELILSMFAIYTERNTFMLKKILRRAFTDNAVFDLPAFHVNSSEKMRILSRLMSVPFWKLEVVPKLVTVQMLSIELGRIDVEATLRFYPRRFFPYTLVIPEYFDLHGTWTIVAKGDDDRILSVTETLHNLPSAPKLVRQLITFGMTTPAGLVGL
jgi:hypothetical protein